MVVRGGSMKSHLSVVCFQTAKLEKDVQNLAGCNERLTAAFPLGLELVLK